ncbi:hypothetical protein N7519_011267 [Penicillium mononematosum]|uniref:uncharacterized protein n=1 Tax=Penicillium mononematosum TaxID=268346 RepID=UPI0025481A43|nr:uncharacterized protein N7519_011267 [Penicillium mononematosum]KAJ6180806.1 hypothetical protein N7519_011267 [Penicillium mononematosum]
MRYREKEGIGKKKMTLWERNGWGNDEMERLQEEWGASVPASGVEWELPIRHQGAIQDTPCRISIIKGLLELYTVLGLMIVRFLLPLLVIAHRFPTCMLVLQDGHV